MIEQPLQTHSTPCSPEKNCEQPFKIAIVIPVYNHADQLPGVIEAALALAMPVIVVDDGSSDGAVTAASRFPSVTVLRHARNQGKGGALLTGFMAASKLADWALTIDADGQHIPADAASLIHAVPPGTRPIVVGRRTGMHDQAGVPWTSRFGRGFSNFWVRCAGGPRLSDTQSGFRLYPLPETLRLNVRARRYQYEVEVLVKARWHGMAVHEAPVGVEYQAGGRRVSHFRPFVDFCRNSATFSRLITQRILLFGRLTGKTSSP